LVHAASPQQISNQPSFQLGSQKDFAPNKSTTSSITKSKSFSQYKNS